MVARAITGGAGTNVSISPLAGRLPVRRWAAVTNRCIVQRACRCHPESALSAIEITELLGDGIGPELAESLHAVADALPVDFTFSQVDWSLDTREAKGDAAIDEGTEDLGEVCVEGLGVCAAEGVVLCERAGARCTAVAGEPRDEQLNDLDDDCDGEVDEGECETVVQACFGGQGEPDFVGLLLVDLAGWGDLDVVREDGVGRSEYSAQQDRRCDGESGEPVAEQCSGHDRDRHRDRQESPCAAPPNEPRSAFDAHARTHEGDDHDQFGDVLDDAEIESVPERSRPTESVGELEHDESDRDVDDGQRERSSVQETRQHRHREECAAAEHQPTDVEIPGEEHAGTVCPPPHSPNGEHRRSEYAASAQILIGVAGVAGLAGVVGVVGVVPLG